MVQEPPKDSVTDGALVFIAEVIGNTHTNTLCVVQSVREDPGQIMIHVTSQFDSADVYGITHNPPSPK